METKDILKVIQTMNAFGGFAPGINEKIFALAIEFKVTLEDIKQFAETHQCLYMEAAASVMVARMLEANVTEPGAVQHSIDRVECYVSNSSNTTWKAFTASGDIIYLRQAHKAMLTECGIWDMLNKMVPGDVWNANLQISTVPDGDFLKPIKVKKIGELKPPVQSDDVPEYPANETDVMEWADRLITEGNFVILDTETTGMDGYPIEVAVIDPDGKVLFNKRIKPPAGVVIDAKAEAVHGITLESLKDAPEWNQVYEEFRAAITDKRIIIYNAQFDVGVLDRVAKRYSLFTGDHRIGSVNRYPWESVECAMLQYAMYNGEWNDFRRDYKWVGLAQAAQKMGVEIKDQHSALGDCLMTLGVIRALRDRAYTKNETPNGIPF